MGKVMPLRPSDRELSAAEAMANMGDAFERFCVAIERTKEKNNEVCNEVCIEKVSEREVGKS